MIAAVNIVRCNLRRDNVVLVVVQDGNGDIGSGNCVGFDRRRRSSMMILGFGWLWSSSGSSGVGWHGWLTGYWVDKQQLLFAVVIVVLFENC